MSTTSPSTTDAAAYRNEILIEDLAALMRYLGIERAHVGGLSMGGNVALNFGIARRSSWWAIRTSRVSSRASL